LTHAWQKDLASNFEKSVQANMKTENSAIKEAIAWLRFFEKFSPEQITKFLDNEQRELDKRRRMQRTQRWFNLAYVVLSLGALFFLIVFFLPRDKALLTDFLTFILVFAGGLGGGYGLKSYQEKKQ
jgi:hypothetical protein